MISHGFKGKCREFIRPRAHNGVAPGGVGVRGHQSSRKHRGNELSTLSPIGKVDLALKGIGLGIREDHKECGDAGDGGGVHIGVAREFQNRPLTNGVHGVENTGKSSFLNVVLIKGKSYGR